MSGRSLCGRHLWPSCRADHCHSSLDGTTVHLTANSGRAASTCMAAMNGFPRPPLGLAARRQPRDLLSQFRRRRGRLSRQSRCEGGLRVVRQPPGADTRSPHHTGPPCAISPTTPIGIWQAVARCWTMNCRSWARSIFRWVSCCCRWAVIEDDGRHALRFPHSPAPSAEDHDFCTKLSGTRGEMKHGLKLRDPSSGRRMEVWTTEGCMQTYTAIHWQPQMLGHTGPLQPAHALAIEPQNVADAHQQSGHPLNHRPPGAAATLTCAGHRTAERRRCPKPCGLPVIHLAAPARVYGGTATNRWLHTEKWRRGFHPGSCSEVHIHLQGERTLSPSRRRATAAGRPGYPRRVRP